MVFQKKLGKHHSFVHSPQCRPEPGVVGVLALIFGGGGVRALIFGGGLRALIFGGGVRALIFGGGVGGQNLGWVAQVQVISKGFPIFAFSHEKSTVSRVDKG